MIVEGSLILVNKPSRTAFIRRVYLILSLQLAFMLAFVALCFYVEVLHALFVAHAWLLHAAYAQFVIVSIPFFHCDNLRRKTPWNYICLVLFTLSLAIVVVFYANFFDFKTIVNSLAFTVAIELVSTAIASQGILDLTSSNVLLNVLPAIALTLTFIFFVVRTNFLPFMLFLGILLFGLSLLQCTQLVLGDQYKYMLSQEEILGAAMFLYNDVIILLMCFSFTQYLLL